MSALLRRHRRWFDGEGSTEQRRWRRRKQRRKNRRRRCLGLYNAAQKLKEATLRPLPCQHDAKDGHAHDWNAEEGRRRCSSSGEHCSSKLQNCHPPNFTNYSQIFITTQKYPKTKVVPNQKFYNFAFETISKFILHFEIQI